MWLVSGALVVTFASYVALPFGLAWYLPQFAAQHGVRLDVGRVRVDPFSSRLSFSGVRVATPDDSSIEWSNVETRVDLAELASGRLVFDRFHLSEAKLHAGDPGADGTSVLPRIPAAWPEEVSVGELVIEDIELATFAEALGHPATVDQLRISSLDGVFRPEGAEVEADLSIGDGRSRLHGRLNFGDTGWILNASEIVATDVPLDGFPTLLGADGSWRGRLDGAGPVRLVYSPNNGAFNATIGGRWAVESLDMALPHVEISGARADWDGAAFLVFSGDVVDTLSIDGEVGLREFRMDVADALGVEATELTLKLDASQGPEPHLVVEGHIPEARFKGRGGVFEAVEAEATQVFSRVALTIANGFGIEVERLASNALDATLPAGRSVGIEQIELQRIVVESGWDTLSTTAGTAERVDWRGFAGPESSGSVTRLAIERIEREGDGDIRFGASSAESVEDRNVDAVLQLREVTLDSTTISADGAMATNGARIGETWFASDTSTLILERLALEGLERDTGGVVGIASARARVVDHTYAGRQTIVGTDVEVAGGKVSGRAWEASHIRFGAADIGTGAASCSLEELTLADAAGETARASARRATLEALDLGVDGYRLVADSLSADAPTWRGETWGVQTLDVGSAILDTPRRHRWLSDGLHLTGVETTASRGASANRATLDSLVLRATDDAMTGAQQVVLEELSFDGESAIRARIASARRTYFRATNGLGIDVAGLTADAVAWNGEALAAEQGAAPLTFLTAMPVRASFDSAEFAFAVLGTGGVRKIGALTSASVRGNVERVFEWTSGALALNGYHSPDFGEATFESLETHDFKLVGDGNKARLRAGRAAVNGTRIDSSGDAVVESVEVDAITVDDPSGHTSTSVRALRASPLTVRRSALEIGALSLAGFDTEVGLSESGGWELPVLPIDAGDAQSPIRVRIREAIAAGSDSVIRVMDRTTDPDFMDSVRIGSAALHAFDTAAVGVPARFSIEAASDTFAALQADGVLVPTLTGTDFEVNAAVQELSLSKLSPYTRLHLGQPVENGRADVTFNATVRTSDLEGIANIALSGLVLGVSDPPAETPGLDAALDSLEDEQGRIELRVALRGELDAPDFDFDALVARAIASAALQNAKTLPEAE